jgi:hypothetical protein
VNAISTCTGAEGKDFSSNEAASDFTSGWAFCCAARANVTARDLLLAKAQPDTQNAV